MNLSQFDYYLPKELIAQYPLKQRDNARLLVLKRADGSICHTVFNQVHEFLQKGDLFVINDSRVLNARLSGKRSTGGKVEILLVRKRDGCAYEALIKPARLKLNEVIELKEGLSCRITGRNEVTFPGTAQERIYGQGAVPLPPYIKREPDADDAVFYQNVYSSMPGSIASPTAGLHFTPELMEAIRESGRDFATLTLHVGLGTFKPVKSQDVVSHVMESEDFFIPEGTIGKIKECSDRGGRVVAVGTTSCRCLESYASLGITNGSTKLFIYPGYSFRIARGLLTNFHLPKTTLFMLVCAFAGRELAYEAYKQAIEKGYRFYSYGDAMLIL